MTATRNSLGRDRACSWRTSLTLFAVAAATLLRTPVSGLEYERGTVTASLTGAIEVSGLIPFDGGSPREDPSAVLVLKPQANVGSHVTLYGEFRGGYEGSQLNPANDGWLIRFDEVYPSKNRYAEIAEAYLGVYLSHLDLRLGIQKFAWGTLDQFNPTDNLNAWDLRDPFTTDALQRKVGTLAARALFGSSVSSIQVETLWIPFYVPYRMADPGDRWYPPLFEAVNSIEVPSFGLPFDLPAVNIVQTNVEPDLPPRTLENSEFGIRLSRTIGSADLGVSYFWGYDRMPVFGVDGTVVASLQLLPPDLALDYVMSLQPEIHRIQVFGFDFAAGLGAFTARAEGAYIKDRYINVGLEAIPEITEDFRFPDLSEIDVSLDAGELTVSFPFSPQIAFPKDLLSVGGGFDYQWGAHLFTFQMVGTSILNYEGEPLIYKEFELNMILGVNSRFLEDTLLVEGGLLLNPMDEFWMVSIEASYLITDAWTVGTRLLLLEGDRKTYLGQYSPNDQIGCYLRYSF